MSYKIIEDLLRRRLKSMETKNELLETAKKLQMSAAALVQQANKVEQVSELKIDREKRKARKETFAANVARGIANEERNKKNPLYFKMHKDGFLPVTGPCVPPNSFTSKTRKDVVVTVSEDGHYTFYKDGKIVQNHKMKDEYGAFIAPSRFMSKL